MFVQGFRSNMSSPPLMCLHTQGPPSLIAFGQSSTDGVVGSSDIVKGEAGGREYNPRKRKIYRLTK